MKSNPDPHRTSVLESNLPAKTLITSKAKTQPARIRTLALMVLKTVAVPTTTATTTIQAFNPNDYPDLGPGLLPPSGEYDEEREEEERRKREEEEEKKKASNCIICNALGELRDWFSCDHRETPEYDIFTDEYLHYDDVSDFGDSFS